MAVRSNRGRHPGLPVNQSGRMRQREIGNDRIEKKHGGLAEQMLPKTTKPWPEFVT